MQPDLTGDPEFRQDGSSESLYGLTRKRDLILQHIYSGIEGPFIVLGLKGVGKSRLIRAVRCELEKAQPEDHGNRVYHVLDIKPGSIPDRRALVHEIRDGLLPFIEGKIGSVPEELSSFTFSNDSSTNASFVTYLERVRVHLRHETTVCIIDHFNEVFEAPENGMEYKRMVALFTSIKTSFSSEPDPFRLVFLLGMPRRIPLLELQGWRPQYIKVGRINDEAEFCEMCSAWATRYHLSPESLPWLYRYTFGFPNLAFMLMNAANEYFEERDLPSVAHPSEMIGALVQTAVQALTVSEELRDWLKSFTEEERQVLTHMATNGGLISDMALQEMPEPLRNACDDLCRSGIFGWSKEGYTMLVPCMLDVLSPRQVRSREPSDNISSFTAKLPVPVIYKGLVIYEKSRRIVVDGQELEKVPPHRHFRLLCYMARQAGKWVPHEELIAQLYSLKDHYGEKDIYYEGGEKTHMSRLRDELGPGAKYLRNQRSLGYGLFEAQLRPDE